MPRLSKKTMFALEAVLDVAFHVGEHPVRSGDITERQRIPKRYLEQVLQHLVRAGILSGKRGPRGGYRLGRDRTQITVANAPGTIDADYRGEVGVILINLSREPFKITRGMRIAQLVVARHARAIWREVGELDRTARGAGGFGSTGVATGNAKAGTR